MVTDAREAGMDRLEAALVRQAEAQARTQERLKQLTARVEDVARSLARAEDQISLLARETGRLKGWALEIRYRDKAHAYFQRILRRISPVPSEELVTLADEAEEKGVLSPEDHVDLLHADVVIRGQLRDSRVETYLVAAVSSMVDPEDVERAARRAKLMARLVPAPVIAAMAGEWVTQRADEKAMRLGVWRILNGRVFPPDASAVEL